MKSDRSRKPVTSRRTPKAVPPPIPLASATVVLDAIENARRDNLMMFESIRRDVAADLAATEARLRIEIASVRTDLRADLTAMEARILLAFREG